MRRMITSYLLFLATLIIICLIGLAYSYYYFPTYFTLSFSLLLTTYTHSLVRELHYILTELNQSVH